MEFKAFEPSRVVLLTFATRKMGQIFLPDAIAALQQRYRFQIVPGATELGNEILSFKIGEMDGVGINEFSIYSDGVIVETRANTSFIDKFLSDVLDFAERELGIEETGIPPRERHYESHVVVSMDINPRKMLPIAKEAQSSLVRSLGEYGLRPFNFDFAAFSFATDATAYGGRKPIPFTLARRINVPFDAGIFFSSAPLATDDHLGLLERLEHHMR